MIRRHRGSAAIGRNFPRPSRVAWPEKSTAATNAARARKARERYVPQTDREKGQFSTDAPPSRRVIGQRYTHRSVVVTRTRLTFSRLPFDYATAMAIFPSPLRPVRTVASLYRSRLCKLPAASDICVRIAHRVVTIYKMKLQRHVHRQPYVLTYVCAHPPSPHSREFEYNALNVTGWTDRRGCKYL